MDAPRDLDALAAGFAAFFQGAAPPESALLVRAVADGSLLRRLDPKADESLRQFLTRIAAIPDRKAAAWTAWNLLQERAQKPAPSPRRRRSPLWVLLFLPVLALLILGGTWLAVTLGWTNAPSRIERRTFGQVFRSGDIRAGLEDQIATRRRIESLLAHAPENAQLVWRVLSDSGDGPLVSAMLLVIDSTSAASVPVTGNVFLWAHDPAWDSCALAVAADLPAIRAAAAKTGLPARLVALPAICEQLRRTESFREAYKRIFSRFVPAGNLSMGVTGIKPETLRATSAWLPSADRPLIDSVSDDSLASRLKSPDHAWAYLYAALCMKGILRRWAAAGIDLSRRPEIVMTVYNLGSNRCPPRPDPQAGGAVFRIGTREYSFGSFAWEFYWSGILYPQLSF